MAGHEVCGALHGSERNSGCVCGGGVIPERWLAEELPREMAQWEPCSPEWLETMLVRSCGGSSVAC